MNRNIFTIALIIMTAFTPLCNLNATEKANKPTEPKRGYKITLTIKNATDTVMYLGNYYAGSAYVFDTAHIDKKGRFLFEKKDYLMHPGMYFFANQQFEYVEFVVHNETPNFTFETQQESWMHHMQVKGSKENEYLFAFHRADRRIYSQIDSAKLAMGDGADFNAFRKSKMHQLDSIKTSIIAAHPKSMIALMMNATREPDVPATDSTGRNLSDRERWEYYMEHYFDYMALDDDALVRTPEMIFHKRVIDYLDRNLKNASAEIICHYVDKLIDRARPSKENFKYLVHTISEKYLQSTIMSYDAIYVHMVKKYIETGECFWMSPSTVEDNVNRANIWDRLLIGRKAPELILKDSNGQFRSMHQQKNKYTLLVFWSPTCGHCKVIIPELYKKYAKYKDKYDICAFAILSEPDDYNRPKWRDFIKNYGLDWINLDGGEANIDWHEVYDVITTPQIYLLDKDKNILAKKLNAETFEMVLKAIEGDNDEPDSGQPENGQ